MFYSLIYLALAIIPAIIYMMIVYITVPTKTINVKDIIRYFVYGFISVAIVLSVGKLFPWIYFKIGDPFYDLLILNFIQIGLIEESSKFMSYKLANRIKVEVNPIAIMIYCGVAALGFSFIENVKYASIYGIQVLPIRCMTMILHFTCGLIMGYWIALGSLTKKNMGKHSIFDYWMIKYPHRKKVIFSIIGISCATVIHGIFDYIAMSLGAFSLPIEMVLLVSVCMIAYVCFTDLFNKISKKR